MKKYAIGLKLWLWIGLIMVFVQVLIGGITRLTDSGLSITDWEIVQGVIPPIGEAEWQEAFNEYKTEAAKQYETLHPDMTLSEFKGIYFWEYFHRMWARLMGFVFIIPFIYFLIKKEIDRKLLKKLLVVILCASLAGIFGWIMVKSGLNNDDRTWVSAYKLVIHLVIAIATFAAIYWTIASVSNYEAIKIPTGERKKLKTMVYILLIVTAGQIILGGLMAGMRAALIHPYWPAFMHGSSFMHALGDIESFTRDDLLNYEPSIFIKAWVQAFHRTFAYLILLMTGIIYLYTRRKYWVTRLRVPIRVLLLLVFTQIILGITTIINSIGSIPVVWGVLHQITAIILVAAELHILYRVNVKE